MRSVFGVGVGASERLEDLVTEKSSSRWIERRIPFRRCSLFDLLDDLARVKGRERGRRWWRRDRKV